MNSALSADAQPVTGFLGLAEVLRGWTWRHTAIGCLLGLWNIALGPAGGLLLWPAPAESKQYGTAVLFNVLCLGLPFVLAVRLADHAVDAGAGAWRAYGLAVLAVAVAGSWAGWATDLSVWGGHVATQARNAWVALGIATQYGLGLAAYVHWRRAHRANARLRDAETERARQLQELQSQRLMALQARVDPQLLFDTLRRVHDLVIPDIPAADALLAELIALLRAMLPRVGDPSSDVRRELALMRSYAAVCGLAPPRIEADASVQRAAIAPMLALPLLRSVHAVIGPARACAVAVRLDGDRLRLRFAADPAAPAGPSDLRAVDLQSLRERLAAVYGDTATLTHSAESPTALLLDLPLHLDHHDAHGADR